MDRFHLETEKELSYLEDEISAIYTRSADEISDKWREHMDSVQKRAGKAYDKYLAAADPKDKAELLNDYKRILRNATLQNARYAEMIGDVTQRIARANEMALDCANGAMPKMYTINYNGGCEGISKGIGGYSFTLCDENTVRYLAENDKLILPKRRLDVPKDEQWNTKKLNAEVLQGIIQGESVGKIADRVQRVTNTNRVSAVRAARTMTTGAENKGRLDSYRNAERMGIKLKKQWMAALDGRTRHTHRLLDGQTKPNDKPFEVEGKFIMYPGDPSADASLVYNCRCTMVADIEDVPGKLNPEGKPAWADGMSDQEYSDWRNGKSHNPEVDKSDESGIIRLKEKLASGDITLTLNAEKQAPHMERTRIAGKSYFTIGIEELQTIVNEKHGTGTVHISKSGQIKETITIDKIVGVDISPISGETPTNRIKIHYSKRRTHVVPTLVGD